jgi:hypothetical protein
MAAADAEGQPQPAYETFISAIETTAEHGPKHSQSFRNDDPAAYLRIVASLVPRDLILKREQEPFLICPMMNLPR